MLADGSEQSKRISGGAESAREKAVVRNVYGIFYCL
jgi:hypothetical protein